MKTEEVKGNNDFVQMTIDGDRLESIAGWFKKFKPMVYLNRILTNGSM
jgi:hypothetical protein